MAGVKQYWFEEKTNHRVDYAAPYFYESCIFQQQWYQYCKQKNRLGDHYTMRIENVDYLTRLLLDSLLKQDFITGSRCVTALCGSIKRVPELVWRTGMEVLMSYSRHHARIVQFFKYVFMLCYKNQDEILIDFAMYLVQYNRNITEAYELINTKSTNRSLGSNKLLHGYMGVFEYILWKLNESKQKRLSQSLDDKFEGDEPESKLNDNLYHASKALQLFEGLVDIEGVWDIFVLRQIEILMFMGDFDRAQRTLEKYREKNQDNPNTHRYLYYFHKKQGSPRTTLMSTLEGLFHVDPTSELVREYYILVMDSWHAKECTISAIWTLVEVLFTKLDYHSSKDSMQDWKALADSLKICFHDDMNNNDVDEKLKQYWDERSDWWPGYHFREINLTISLSCHVYSVVLQKARVATFLLGKDSKFVKSVKKLRRVRKINDTPQNSEQESSTCDELSQDSDDASVKQLKRRGNTEHCESPLKRKKH